MTKVYVGVATLVLLIGFAWVSFDNQRVKVEPTVTPVVQVASPLVPAEMSLLPTITPEPLTESVSLPTVGNE